MSRARLRKCLQFRHLKPASTNAKLLAPRKPKINRFQLVKRY
ncbi:MAG: hypothetical protein ACP6IP_04895 [Candidatus Njordarchaeia archaeon]